MQRDGFLVQTNHRFSGAVGLLIDRQNVFHLSKVLGVEIGDAPHFFPATASGRGCSTKHGWSRVPRAEPVFASRLPRRSAAPSNALVPPGADCTPSRSRVAFRRHPTVPGNHVLAARTKPLRVLLFDSDGQSDE